MFGFNKARQARTRRRWKDAPSPGSVDVLPDDHPDSEAASSLLRRVWQEVAGGEDQSHATLAKAHVSVRVFPATPTPQQPLTFVVDAAWKLSAAEVDITEVLERLNQWNATHTVPRVYAEIDAARGGAVDGASDDSDPVQVNIRADSELSSAAGVTVQQLDEWMRRALAGISAVESALSQWWSDAVTAVDVDLVDLPLVDGDVTELVVAGNHYGLRGGQTPPLLLPRLGSGTEVREEGASGRRGNGYLRFPEGPDASLHDGTLTVSDSVTVGEFDADTRAWLLNLVNRVNALPGGVVAVVGAILTCAVHHPVGSGMADAQITEVISRDRAAVSTMMRLLIAEIGGDVSGDFGGDAGGHASGDDDA